MGLRKLRKFPVNPCILLYGVCRRILVHRQEYRASHGIPVGCFFCTRIRGFLCAMVPMYARHHAQSHQNPSHCIPCPKSRCLFILLFIVISGIIHTMNKATSVAVFLLPAVCGAFFYLPKGITNENTTIFAAAVNVARIHG